MLECLGTDSTQMTVSAGAIVERLDVVEHIGLGEFARFVDALLDAFFLQTAEERFGQGNKNKKGTDLFIKPSRVSAVCRAPASRFSSRESTPPAPQIDRVR